MKKILVVEDDADIREVLADLYGGLGYETATAGDGREALARVRASHPDLVVLDLMMPVMSGWEFMDAWRRDPELAGELAHAHVVAFTAAGGAPPEGVQEVVRKPGDLDVLAALAQRHLGAP